MSNKIWEGVICLIVGNGPNPPFLLLRIDSFTFGINEQ